METEIDETDDLIRILFIRVQPDENGNRPHVIQHESGGYFLGRSRPSTQPSHTSEGWLQLSRVRCQVLAH
jgi:hypothetical protein